MEEAWMMGWWENGGRAGASNAQCAGLEKDVMWENICRLLSPMSYMCLVQALRTLFPSHSPNMQLFETTDDGTGSVSNSNLVTMPGKLPVSAQAAQQSDGATVGVGGAGAMRLRRPWPCRACLGSRPWTRAASSRRRPRTRPRAACRKRGRATASACHARTRASGPPRRRRPRCRPGRRGRAGRACSRAGLQREGSGAARRRPHRSATERGIYTYMSTSPQVCPAPAVARPVAGSYSRAFKSRTSMMTPSREQSVGG